MARQTKAYGPKMRLQLGASVLSAARSLDTRAVKARLARFERVHQEYVSAQEKLDAAQAGLRVAQDLVMRLDMAAGETIERLAGALIFDGQPRTNPFEAYGVPAPKALAALPWAEEAAAVHELVAAIQRSKGIGAVVLEAAQAVDDAERKLEAAAVPIGKLQEAVRDARRTRDALAPGWDTALANLRHDVLAAAGEGAPDLYKSLFPAVVRTTPKKTEPSEPNAPPTSTTTAAA